ncbi:hypothetical protein ARMGADRAFT_453669 [Armillaria gallica]|uniref:Uncharacterized protein n=1 Tax=Armillaria gallica TaxID=47427 RepID=A0A2H3CXJ1_ARMGA|nr:hypothetical protein ARMGADRAFT_453669 [Armillaria gallica]
MRTTIWTARKGDVQRHVYQLLPCHSSPYILSASFHRKIQNLSQHKATEAYGRSKLPAQSTLTGDVLTNPKVVDSVTGADILVDTGSYSRLAWECGCLAKLPHPPASNVDVRVNLLTSNS